MAGAACKMLKELVFLGHGNFQSLIRLLARLAFPREGALVALVCHSVSIVHYPLP